MVALDSDDGVRFLAAAEGSAYRDVFFVALYTGLRMPEDCALKWSSVDLDALTINVVAGLHRLPGQVLVMPPTKTAKSRRSIAITPEVSDLLRQIRGAQILQQVQLGDLWQDTGFVITKPDGNPVDPDAVTHEFPKVLNAAGLKSLRLHDLRHTHPSLTLKVSVNPKLVSERLGHSSISVTMDVYSHMFLGLQMGAALRFSKLLTRPDKE